MTTKAADAVDGRGDKVGKGGRIGRRPRRRAGATVQFSLRMSRNLYDLVGDVVAVLNEQAGDDGPGWTRSEVIEAAVALYLDTPACRRAGVPDASPQAISSKDVAPPDAVGYDEKHAAGGPP